MYRDRNDPAVGAKLSEVLLDLSTDASRDRISLRELFDALDDRALAALIFIFALPNVVPTPPGTSAVLGVPLVILSAQLLAGTRPWLPNFLAQRSMSREIFKVVIDKAAPWLSRSERLMRPRLLILCSGPMERLIGAICLILGVILMLPIPLGNMLPALAICVLALGVLERDGLWIVAGCGVTGVAVGVLWGAAFGAIKAIGFLAERLNY